MTKELEIKKEVDQTTIEIKDKKIEFNKGEKPKAKLEIEDSTNTSKGIVGKTLDKLKGMFTEKEINISKFVSKNEKSVVYESMDGKRLVLNLDNLDTSKLDKELADVLIRIELGMIDGIVFHTNTWNFIAKKRNALVCAYKIIAGDK